jgi:hypothetical protein
VVGSGVSDSSSGDEKELERTQLRTPVLYCTAPYRTVTYCTMRRIALCCA